MVFLDFQCSLFCFTNVFYDSLGGDPVFIAGLCGFREIVVDK